MEANGWFTRNSDGSISIDSRVTSAHITSPTVVSYTGLYDELVRLGAISVYGDNIFFHMPAEQQQYVQGRIADYYAANGAPESAERARAVCDHLRTATISSPGGIQGVLFMAQSAAHSSEPGSGFTMLDVQMAASTYNATIQLQTSQRLMWTVISAVAQQLERCASMLSDSAVSSGSYSKTQIGLNDQFMGMVESQVSRVQSHTIDIIDQLNTLNRMRIQNIQQNDAFIRIANGVETWGPLVASVLLLVPSGITQAIGLATLALSHITGLFSSWQQTSLLENTDQRMDDSSTLTQQVSLGSGFDQLPPPPQPTNPCQRYRQRGC